MCWEIQKRIDILYVFPLICCTYLIQSTYAYEEITFIYIYIPIWLIWFRFFSTAIISFGYLFYFVFFFPRLLFISCLLFVFSFSFIWYLHNLNSTEDVWSELIYHRLMQLICDAYRQIQTDTHTHRHNFAPEYHLPSLPWHIMHVHTSNFCSDIGMNCHFQVVLSIGFISLYPQNEVIVFHLDRFYPKDTALFRIILFCSLAIEIIRSELFFWII